MKYQTLVAAALALALSNCGGSSSPSSPTVAPTPVPVTKSVVVISSAPDPIIATASGDPQFPFTMTYTIHIAETAGLGCNVNQIIRTYKDKATNLEIVTGSSNPDDVIRLAKTNHIAASGSLDVGPFALTYRGSNGGRQLVLTLTVEVIDDKGNRFSVTKDVQVL